MTLAEKRIISYGIAASVAVHVLLFIAIGIWLSAAAMRNFSEAEPVPEEPPPAEELLIYPEDIAIVEAPTPEPETETTPTPVQPEPPKRENYIRTSQNAGQEAPPPKADFGSDRNTTASAKLPGSADGDPTLPTTKGVGIPMMELANRDYRDGELKNDSAPSAPAMPPALAQTEPSPPSPPNLSPPAEPSPELEPKMTPPQEVEPEPQPPEASPEMTVVKKEDSSLESKMREAEEVLDQADVDKERLPLEVRKPDSPPEQDKPQPKESKEPVADTPPAPKPQPPPAPPVPKAIPVAPPLANTPRPEAEAFQPFTRTSEIKGGINQPGDEDAVNAADTPQGRYRTLVYGAIAKKWHRLRNEKKEFVEPGKLRLKFYLNKDGQPSNISIVFDEINAVVTDFSISAILQAEIPPIPKELLPMLDKERMEMNYDIVIY